MIFIVDDDDDAVRVLLDAWHAECLIELSVVGELLAPEVNPSRQHNLGTLCTC